MVDTGKMNEIKTYIADTEMITSLGAGVGVNLKALSEGRSGVVSCDDPRLAQRKIMLGKIPESAYVGLWERYGYYLTRAEVLTVACIDRIFSGNILIPEKTGFILATAKGNIDTLEGRCGSEDNLFVPEENDPVFMTNMASRIASRFGFSSSSVHIISNACISGVPPSWQPNV
jgi:3-oxoacyl-(acyl-carrier-protein) synthase